MKFKIITFFLVFHIATGIKKPKDEVKHIKKKVNDCKDISCPAVEEPICMKLKNKKSNRTAFVILLNKCEMGYMKCHKDMEGNTVPMKYCEHTSTPGAKHKSHTRRKRSATKIKEKIKLALPTDEVAYDETADQGIDPSKLAFSYSYAESLEIRSDKVKLNKAAGSENEEIDSPDKTKLNQEANSENEAPDKKKLTNMEASSENEDFLGSPEYDDAYNADCPKECPARVRLVCGQCDHGVYKTFLSTCHLRLFNCAQNLERMQLITRNACLSSSPLLTGEAGEELHLEPDGRVYDRDDADPVLAFIRCRNRNSIMVDENGLEIIDAGACKDIGTKLRQDEDYES